MNTIPNLFIIGAAKAGTTSLYYQLKTHPDIYFSPLKEPNFFSTDIKIEDFTAAYKKRTVFVDDSYFNKTPLKELQLSFVRDLSQYNQLFRERNNQKIVGEASTSYLYSTEAAKNIFSFNPSAKIIAIIRNPVKRSFSHYQMALRYGFTALDFRKAIENDIKNPVKGWGQSELFIELSLYHNQLKRYFDIFPENQIKVILFDKLINEPEKSFNEIWQFLSVEPINLSKLIEKNTAEIPRFSKANKLVSDIGIKQVMGKMLGNKAKQKLKPLFFDKGEKTISKKNKEFLLPFFEKDLQKTSNLIGIDLMYWLDSF